MKTIPSLLWLCMFSQYICPALGQEPRLVASSPFFMTLRPTSKELDYTSLQALEKVMAETILEKDNTGDFRDMDVAVQQVDYVPKGNATDIASPAVDDNSPSTRIRFFALGIAPVTDSNTESDLRLQSQLNTLVENSFLDGIDGTFLLLLRSDPILGESQSVMVERIVAPGNDDDNSGASESSSKASKLSFLDIALITVSGLILLGVLYMVVEHIKDRGFIESERQRVLNQANQSFNESLVLAEQGYASPLDSSQNESGLKVVGKVEPPSDEEDDDDDDDETPSTPSTTDSVGEELPTTPERSVHITTTTISAEDPDVLLLKPDKPSFLSEFEEGNKWFHPAHTKPRRLLRKVAHPVSVIAEGDEEDEESSDSLYEGSSDGDESDPFHVDISAVESMDDTTKSVASAASTVTDWMKTIRVVAPNIENQISEEMTASLPDDEEKYSGDSSSAASSSSSSSASSTASSSLISSQSSKLEEEDLENISLEKSLASSCAERWPRRKRDEV